MNDPATIRPKVNRVAVGEHENVVWELLITLDRKLFVLRPADPALHETGALEILAEHMVTIAEEKGTCLGKKRAKELSQGVKLFGWDQGKFILVQGKEDVYGLKMSELIPFGNALMEQLMAEQKKQPDEAERDAQQSRAEHESGQDETDCRDFPV